MFRQMSHIPTSLERVLLLRKRSRNNLQLEGDITRVTVEFHIGIKRSSSLNSITWHLRNKEFNFFNVEAAYNSPYLYARNESCR